MRKSGLPLQCLHEKDLWSNVLPQVVRSNSGLLSYKLKCTKLFLTVDLSSLVSIFRKTLYVHWRQRETQRQSQTWTAEEYDDQLCMTCPYSDYFFATPIAQRDMRWETGSSPSGISCKPPQQHSEQCAQQFLRYRVHEINWKTSLWMYVQLWS